MRRSARSVNLAVLQQVLVIKYDVANIRVHDQLHTTPS